jgi:hypothetical protein
VGGRPVAFRSVAAALLALWLWSLVAISGAAGGVSASSAGASHAASSAGASGTGPFAAVDTSGPFAAAASCLPPADLGVAIASGEVVLVGIVDRVENNGRWATVRVEERWYGAAAVGASVLVRGGPEPGTATSTDRTFAVGGRYLFVTTAGNGHLVDNLCTVTQPWSAELARHRPRGVEPIADRPPAEPAFALPPELVPVIALFGALIVVIVAYRVILVARRRPPDWMR